MLKKINKKFDLFNVCSYKTQVVSGINYFIKIELKDNEYIHLRVYKSLTDDHKLISYKYPLNKDNNCLFLIYNS